MENQIQKSNEKIAMRVSYITIAENVILTAFKLIAGIFAHSGAMISDAIHSASDVLSTLVVIAGVKLSGMAEDKNHQYGHERLECVAAILLAVMLAATGIGIGYSGIEKIHASTTEKLVVPGTLALIAAIVSIIVKETMYWYTRAAAKKINSSAVMADAWHHRSDALSSVGSFIGIFGARMGYPVLDPIASVVICVFIIKVSYNIFMDSIRKMTDESCDDNTISRMGDMIRQQNGVCAVDLIKTRLFGSRIYVDIEIEVDGNLRLQESHAIAENVHDSIEQAFPMVKHCMVHVNPAVDVENS